MQVCSRSRVWAVVRALRPVHTVHAGLHSAALKRPNKEDDTDKNDELATQGCHRPYLTNP